MINRDPNGKSQVGAANRRYRLHVIQYPHPELIGALIPIPVHGARARSHFFPHGGLGLDSLGNNAICRSTTTGAVHFDRALDTQVSQSFADRFWPGIRQGCEYLSYCCVAVGFEESVQGMA